MSQSNVVAVFLLIAFLIFVTSRGELPKYAAIFVGSSGGGSGGGDRIMDNGVDVTDAGLGYLAGKAVRETAVGGVISSFGRTITGLDFFDTVKKIQEGK